jgi:glutamate---cysteine ligase / carboxylate-amine ligase
VTGRGIQLPAITLGAEEELQVVDGTTYGLAAHELTVSAALFPAPVGMLDFELSKCTIEAKTDVCSSPGELVSQLRALRQTASLRASSQKQAIVACGLHPFSDWREQAFNEDPVRFPHYARVLDDYQDLARGAMSFGTHVHVGIPDRERRIPVMNRLRELLPLLVAVTANSPFYLSRDTGLHAWRQSLFGRLPRTGVPDVWADENSYVSHVQKLRDAGFLEQTATVWEDIRLHHKYGTLEVRICDVHHNMDRTWLASTMLHVQTVAALLDLDCGKSWNHMHKLFIEESIWQVRRRGMAATMFDSATHDPVTVPQAFGHWLARVRPAAHRLGVEQALEQSIDAALREGTGADEQRRWHKAAGASLQSLVQRLAQATMQ